MDRTFMNNCLLSLLTWIPFYEYKGKSTHWIRQENKSFARKDAVRKDSPHMELRSKVWKTSDEEDTNSNRASNVQWDSSLKGQQIE